MKKSSENFKWKKKLPIGFGILVLMIISSVSIYGLINSVNTGFRATTAWRDIDAHGTCSQVTKTSGSDVFVPTKTSAEWNAFLSNAPTNIDLSACFTYSWKTGSYGDCSESCGGGTKTRSVWCERSDVVTVADSFCTGTKPATSASCNTHSCCTNKTLSLGTNGGTCSTACTDIGQSCYKTWHYNVGTEGRIWEADFGCNYKVRGWSGDCGQSPENTTSCSYGKESVKSGSATCYCKC